MLFIMEKKCILRVCFYVCKYTLLGCLASFGISIKELRPCICIAKTSLFTYHELVTFMERYIYM